MDEIVVPEEPSGPQAPAGPQAPIKPPAINKEDVFEGCCYGQHENPDDFSTTCSACMYKSVLNLIDILNAVIK